MSLIKLNIILLTFLFMSLTIQIGFNSDYNLLLKEHGLPAIQTSEEKT